MVVEIANVKRANGKVLSVTMTVGDIEIRYMRLNGEPREVSKMRHGVQVLDRDTLWISPADFRTLKKKVGKIFDEDRSSSPKVSPLQGTLFSSTDL